MSNDEKIEAAAIELHYHRYGSKNDSPASWAVSRRAAWLALTAAGVIK